MNIDTDSQHAEKMAAIEAEAGIENVALGAARRPETPEASDFMEDALDSSSNAMPPSSSLQQQQRHSSTAQQALKLKLGRVVGSGTFAIVHKALLNGKLVACKVR